MAVLSAKGNKTPAGKAKAASTSSSSKASSIGSVVSGNWGVGSTYSNTGNTIADKAVREAQWVSAQQSANEIAAAHASGDSDRLAAANTMPTTTAKAQKTAPVTQQNQVANAQPAAQTWTTATTPQTVEWMSVDAWNKKNLAQQKLWMKMHPEVDISKFGREMAKSAWAKIQEQNTQPAWEWLWPKPTPVTAPTATAEVPQWPDFQDKSAGRLAEIAANLEAAYQQTPSVFNNRELFEAEFDYAKRSQSQKTVLDDFYKRKAQESLLNSTSAEDIVSSIASGKTSLEKYNLLKDIDPVKYTAVEDGLHKAQNQMKQQSNVQVANAIMSTWGELTVPPEMAAENAAIESKINSTAEDYKAAVNDPDLMAKRDELTETMSEIDQLDIDIMRTKDDLVEQYWFGITRSQLNAIIADRTDKYRIARSDALIKANTLQGFINNRLDEAQLNYQVDSQTTTQLMNLNSQKLAQLGFAFSVKQWNEQPLRDQQKALFQQWIDQENAMFESDLLLQQNQAKLEQEYEFANPDRDSPDPAVQERALEMSVNRLYEDYGSIIQRSPSQVVADVKKYAKEKWISLSQAMQENFVSQLQAKPQFKQMQNAMVGISNDPSAGMQWGKIWEWTDDNGVVHDTMWLINLNTGAVTPSSFGGGGVGWGWSSQEWMRTDRNNNPTAMTTDVAKTLWLQEWVDYEVGDPFTTGSWSTLYTARLLGDPIETTIKWLDIAANDPNKSAFLTGGWAPRWTHTSMTDQERASLDSAGKVAVVTEMYRREWGNGSLAWQTNTTESDTQTTNTSYDPSRVPDYIKYAEKGIMPTGMKEGSVNWLKFKAEALEWYIAAKEEAFKQKWFAITNPEAYLNTDQETRTRVNEAIDEVPAFIDTMDRLIKLTEEQWTEMPWTESALIMKQLVVDAQLKGKEIYNLWVLNWPDLWLMEAIILDPVWFWPKLAANTPWIWRDYVTLLKNAKQTILSNAYGKGSQVGLSPIMWWGTGTKSPWQLRIEKNSIDSSVGAGSLDITTFPDAT